MRGNAFGVRIRGGIVGFVHHAGDTTALAAAGFAPPVPVRVLAAVALILVSGLPQIGGQQVFGRVGVAAVGGGDRGGGDDLGIRVGGEVALAVRLRFDLVERVTATLDLGDDVVCGGFPDERFGVAVPMLGPGDDRVA